MLPIMQTKFHRDTGKGNCMQAAVASIFDLSIDSVPMFNGRINQEIEFRKWLEEMGLELIRKDFKKWSIPDWKKFKGYFLCVGNSTRNIQHMVVMKDGKVVHDPHPNGDGLVSYKFAYTFTKDGRQVIL